MNQLEILNHIFERYFRTQEQIINQDNPQVGSFFYAQDIEKLAIFESQDKGWVFYS